MIKVFINIFRVMIVIDFEKVIQNQIKFTFLVIIQTKSQLLNSCFISDIVCPISKNIH